MTGLRWWVALLVFMRHISLMVSQQCAPEAQDRPLGCGTVEWVFGTSAVGVTFFTVLSGFVITWSAAKWPKARMFWRSRASKIYPLYLISLAAAMVIFGSTLGMWPTFRSAVANVLLVQTWFTDPYLMLGGHQVAWALSNEIFFYLCFPLLYLGLKRLGPTALRLVGLLAVVWPLLVWPLSKVLLSNPEQVDFVNAVSPWVRINQFVLGMVAALLMRQGRWIGPRAGGALACTVVVLLAAPLMQHYEVPLPLYGIPLVLAPVGAVLIAGLAKSDLSDGWSPLRGRRSQRLGTLSYAFYLFHEFFVFLIGRELPWNSTWQVALNIVVIFVPAFAVTWVMHYGVEMPLARRLDPLRRNSTREAGVSPPA